MIHRFVDLAAGFGTPFWVHNQVYNGVDDDENSDVWYVPIGAPAGTGTGSCVNVTNLPLGEAGVDAAYYSWTIPQPSRGLLLALFTEDGGADRGINIMAPDGTGLVVVNTGISVAPEWLGDTKVAHIDSSSVSIVTADADGTNDTTILTKTHIHGFNASPDGTQIAYVATDSGNILLGICDSDGTNDTTLVASGLGSGSGPVWTLDGARIMYILTGGEVRTIEPDGSNDTSILAAPGMIGFGYPAGMSEDRYFYTNTSTFTNWRPAHVMLDGSGNSIISPNRRVSQSVQRGACVYDVRQGRMFSVLHSSVAPNGVDSVFSILPDGSDFRIHFEAREESFVNPGDNFQNLGFR